MSFFRGKLSRTEGEGAYSSGGKRDGDQRGSPACRFEGRRIPRKKELPHRRGRVPPPPRRRRGKNEDPKSGIFFLWKGHKGGRGEPTRSSKEKGVHPKRVTSSLSEGKGVYYLFERKVADGKKSNSLGEDEGRPRRRRRTRIHPQREKPLKEGPVVELTLGEEGGSVP